MEECKKMTKRQQILDEKLLQYKDFVKVSERNIKIVEEVVAGESYRAIAEKYNLSVNRIAQIVRSYISHCRFFVRGVNVYAPKKEKI